MEKREIVCEKCGERIKITIFSNKLSQVVKCPSCSALFTYDPQKEKEKGNDEEIKLTKDVEEKKKPKQKVSCPKCDFEFEVLLPKIKKKEVLTLCPLCQHEFSFERRDYYLVDLKEVEESPSAQEMEYKEATLKEKSVKSAKRITIFKYLEKNKYLKNLTLVARSFLDFDFHSLKESLLPANLKEHLRNKLGIASLLLFIVFILGITNAFFTLFFGISLGANEGVDENIKFTLTGTVYFKDENVVENAKVELVGENRSTYTNPEGKYWFYNLTKGVFQLRVTHDDYGTAVVKFKIKGRSGELPEEMDVVLPEKGKETHLDLTEEEGNVIKVRTVFLITFLILFFSSIFALLAAISCLLSKNFQTATYGAFIGVLSWGFLLGSILALLSLVLILFSKKEFEKKSFKNEKV